MHECLCGGHIFILNLQLKHATCFKCNLIWETNDEGGIVGLPLPDAHAKAEQEPEQKTMSVFDAMLDLA